MKMVIQVVDDATLLVNNRVISKIGKGLVVYFCVEKNDNEEKLNYFAKKISNLRIFPDENGKTNLSVKDINGEVLLVSQFTLAGEFHHGNRPSFSEAQDPVVAELMYKKLANIINTTYSIPVKLGVFGEDMIVSQTGHGPFTAFIEK